MNASICAIDNGWDLRTTGTLVRVEHLPLDYEEGRGVDAVRRTVVAGMGVETVAETLAAAGYGVVVARTTTGRDVQCTPPDMAPAGDQPGYEWTGPVWAVQAKNDNYWCLGASLASALARAGWRPDDCTVLWAIDA